MSKFTTDGDIVQGGRTLEKALGGSIFTNFRRALIACSCNFQQNLAPFELELHLGNP